MTLPDRSTIGPTFDPKNPVLDHLHRFPYFFGAVNHLCGLDDKAPIGEVELDICHHVESGPNRRGVKAFRGIGKTRMIPVCYAAFRLWRNPQCRIKVISKSHGHAKSMIRELREILDSVFFLNHLIPAPGSTDNDTMFDVGPAKIDKNASVHAVGIDGQITGTRAHVVIPDDIETPENTKTLNARETLKHLTGEFRRVASFADPFEDRGADFGEVVAVGTPHTEESVYDEMAGRGYDIRTWTIMLPPREGDYARSKIRGLAPLLRRRIEEHEAEHGPIGPNDIVPTCGHRFGRENIVDRMSDGPMSFAMNEMLIADLGEGFRPLRLADLIVPDFDFRGGLVPYEIVWGQTDSDGRSTARDDIDRVGFAGDRLHRQVSVPNRRDDGASKWVRCNDVRMFVDPSGHGGDETAYAIAGHVGGFLWVFDVGGMGSAKSGGHGGSETVFERLADTAREFGVGRIIVERNYAGEMFKDTLDKYVSRRFVAKGDPAWPQRPEGWRCSIETQPVGPTSKKERRIIDSLSGPMATHRLVVHQDAIRPTQGLDRKHELQYQISALRPSGGIPHDDRVEALAGVVHSFQSILRTDERVLRGREDDAAQERIEARFRELSGWGAKRRRASVIERY